MANTGFTVGAVSTGGHRIVQAEFPAGGRVLGEPTQLVKVLVPINDAQASFHILRLSSVSHLSHLLRAAPPSITHKASASCEGLAEWAFASIIAGDGAAAAGLPAPEQIARDPSISRNQPYLRHESLRQAYLPI